MGIAHHGSRLIARTAWILATILAASTFLSIYRQPVGWLPGIVVTGLALGAAFSPYNALLVIAGLGSLSASIFALLRTSPVGLDFGEAMVLAFLAGCCARRVVQLRPLNVPSPFAWSAGILLLLALASGVVGATVLRIERPDRSLADLAQYFITRDYFIRANTIRSSMLFAEGVALMLMAADTCGGDRGRRDRLLRMMVVGAGDGRTVQRDEDPDVGDDAARSLVAVPPLPRDSAGQHSFPGFERGRFLLCADALRGDWIRPGCADHSDRGFRPDCRRLVDRRIADGACRVPARGR